MSGLPYWVGKAIGKEILINGKLHRLKDVYCTSDRRGVPNSDELVLVTNHGEYNTSDDGVHWEFSANARKQLGWPDDPAVPVSEKRPPSVALGALLWLRNHLDCGRPELRPAVLRRIDAVLDTNDVSVADAQAFRERYPAQKFKKGKK